MAVRCYRDLIAWQKAMDLVVALYAAVRQFPKDELYGLVSQIRRAGVSVASNIAEGQGRGAGMELMHHLQIARGSLQELETQLLIAQRLECLSSEQVDELLMAADEVSRLVRGLQASISTS